MTTVPPAITAITFDQATYPPGATITATVKYTPGASDTDTSLTFTGTVTDNANGQTGTMEGTFVVQTQVNDATTVSVADSGNRTWTQVSDDGAGTAVFTATA